MIVPPILMQDRIPSAVVRDRRRRPRVAYARGRSGTRRSDTIFDLRRARRSVATTTAVMKLVEEGSCRSTIRSAST
jgi:CubicO group peptidase (beta-lactamase class C family)